MIIPRGVSGAGLVCVLALAVSASAQSVQQQSPSPQQAPPVSAAAAAAVGGGEVVSEKDARRQQARQLAIDGKYSEAYALGKQALVEQPNDLRTLLIVSWSGLFMATSGMPVNNAELSVYAQKALQLIHEGTVPDPNKPFLPQTKEQILGWLEYALGIFMLKTEPDQAIGYLTMAAQSEGFQKYDPQTYALLALAYEKAQYEELAADYRKRFKTPKQLASPEGRATLARITPVINRMIDAYARAVALSGDNPAYAKKKVEWTNQLADFYKFRHGGSATGLDELVAGVLTRPLGTAMDLPMPFQTRPAATANAATAKPLAAPQAAAPQSSQPQAATQGNPPAAAPQSPARRSLSETTSAPADTTTAVAASSSPAPKPKPSPAPASVGLNPMFFSTWSYHLAMNTGEGGGAVSPVSGTIRFSDKGTSFSQDLRIQSAQASFNYKYNGTFSIQGDKLTLTYRDAQGSTKTEVYGFVFSPELKALRLTRDYGRANTSWILFLKGTENVSRCTEQGKTILTDAICQQVRKAG
ncbi:MAG TPA: hypothetical protein VF735_01215 [Pyrinomonadaceae bacterium]|jgi:tetratricopeptide (TPR) repeat protein